MALQHSLEPDEFAYPIDRGGRFDRQSGVAPIAAVCLPGISSEPDRLFGELEAVVPGFPAAEVGVLYRTLFDWLVDRQGARVWVERSGGSLAYCGEIAAHFKDARFVHVYRDGCETALSMSRHPFFRLAVARGTLTRKVDYDSAIPLEVFGRRWSAMILHGTGALRRQNADVWHVSYEDLISTPDTVLRGLVDFLELPKPATSWLAWATTQPRTPRRGQRDIAREELERLRRACEPGERRLRELRAR